MAQLGNDASSADYWSRETAGYVAALEGDYHQHRLSVIRSLIPDDLRQPGKQVFDFGCGDGVLMPELMKAGTWVLGCDPDPTMVEAAGARLEANGHRPTQVSLGGVDVMAGLLGPESWDGLLAFNVLAYLTDEEEATFYAEARRILRPGGYLAVTHSNSLFDLFALNAETGRLLDDLVAPEYRGRAASLLANGESTQTVRYNVRENPLAYPAKLRALGFEEIRQTFSNRHPAPPSLIEGERTYPDTLNVPESERWKLMLTCSTYGSLSRRL